MWLETQLPPYLVTFTEETVNVKLHLLWLKYITSNYEEKQSIAHLIKIDYNIKKLIIQKY